MNIDVKRGSLEYRTADNIASKVSSNPQKYLDAYVEVTRRDGEPELPVGLRAAASGMRVPPATEYVPDAEEEEDKKDSAIYRDLVEDPILKEKAEECLAHVRVFLAGDECKKLRKVVTSFFVMKLGLDAPPVSEDETEEWNEVASSSSQPRTFRVVKRER